MDLRIEELRQKYWAGETTLAEEKELKAFFENNDSPGQEGQYFAYLKEKQQLRPEAAFTHPGRKISRVWWPAAAILLLLLGLGLIFFQSNKKQQFAVEDPKEAFEITRASLMMVSQRLNKAKTYTAELEKINDAKKIINN